MSTETLIQPSEQYDPTIQETTQHIDGFQLDEMAGIDPAPAEHSVVDQIETLDFSSNTENETAGAIVAYLNGRSTDEERMIVNMQFAGLEAGLSVRATSILEQGIVSDEIYDDVNAESTAERATIDTLLDSASSVVAGVMSERSDTLAGKTIEALSKNRTKRVMGQLATSAVLGAGTYLATKGIVGAVDIMSETAESSAGYIGAVVSMSANTLKTVLTGVAGEGLKAVKNNLASQIVNIPLERMQIIQEERSKLPPEEGDELYRQLVAHELVEPLRDKLIIAAHESDINGETGESSTRSPAQLGAEMSKLTAEYLQGMFDTSGEKRKKTIRNVAAKSIEKAVPKIVSIPEAFKGVIMVPAASTVSEVYQSN